MTRADRGPLTGASGTYQKIGAEHSAFFVEGTETLFVTFENLDHVMKTEERLPWGHDFITGNGWSMLGLMAHGWTWYRDAAVHDFFDNLAATGFFDRFERVVFYGASMGAYAAATFARACPGAIVIAISPQATLDRGIARWETRYHKVWHRDFSDRYGFAPDGAATASACHIFYDPTQPLDAMHAALFRGPTIHTFHCHNMGHRIASLWQGMGILKPVVLACLDQTLTPQKFYGLLRKRRGNDRYEREMLARVLARQRPDLTVRLCRAVLARRGGPKFRRALRAAEAELGR